MKHRTVKDPAKLAAKQKARAEILDDLENIKSLLDSDLAKSIELLKTPTFSDEAEGETLATEGPVAKLASTQQIEETASPAAGEAQQQASLFDLKSVPQSKVQASQTQPSIKQPIVKHRQAVATSDKKRGNQTTLFQLDSNSQSELSEIQSDAKTHLRQHMEKLVQQQKHHHLRAIHGELESEANLLVQNMVDDIIPIIEVELRKRLQQEMEYYILELLTHPEAPLY